LKDDGEKLGGDDADHHRGINGDDPGSFYRHPNDRHRRGDAGGICLTQQKSEQPDNDRSELRARHNSIGEIGEQSCQSSRCGFAGQPRQFGCLLPGIDIEAREGGNDTERRAIAVFADRRKQKFIELGRQARL
jgi:hypothetical protein